MNAHELCQRNVVTVRRHEELGTAAWMMRERHVGCLVVDERGRLAGILALDDTFEYLATRHLSVTPIRRVDHPREQVS